MSRCFRFLPAGYERDGTSKDVALIESIKLRREWENAKAERKNEKKREKKDKKEKKLKKEKKCKDEKKQTTIAADQGKWLFRLTSKEECKAIAEEKLVREDEQLEKSVLTEEHQSPVSSSNSIQISNKRKRHSPDSNDESVRGGNIIRIRLCPQRSQESHTSHNRGQACSSGRAFNVKSKNVAMQDQHKAETVGVQHRRKHLGSSDFRPDVSGDMVARPASEVNFKRRSGESVARIGLEAQIKTNIGSVSNVSQSDARVGTEVPNKYLVGSGFTTRKKISNDMHSREVAYNTFNVNWIPSPLKVEENDCDDQSWLFDTKPRELCGRKRCRPINEIPCLSGPGFWPIAHHIPEADLYALPYTVPF